LFQPLIGRLATSATLRRIRDEIKIIEGQYERELEEITKKYVNNTKN